MTDLLSPRLRRRIAGRLLAALSAVRPPEGPALPEADWSALARALRRLRLAHERGWSSAWTSARSEADRTLRGLRRSLDRIGLQLLPPPRRPPVTLACLDADLRALAEEFPRVSCDPRAGELAVATGRIVLEGIDLGPFEIRLAIDTFGPEADYRIRALDPRTPPDRSEIPHPHVQDEGLCAGEGRLPIRQALAGGRLFDLFLLVRQILETYNPGSAYLPLEQWEGIPCRDCGRFASEAEAGCCDRCGADLCPDCLSACGGCDASGCADCFHRCSGCGSPFCSRCGTGAICASCAEETASDDAALAEPLPTTEAATAAAGAPLHADRLGEVPVPA